MSPATPSAPQSAVKARELRVALVAQLVLLVVNVGF